MDLLDRRWSDWRSRGVGAATVAETAMLDPERD